MRFLIFPVIIRWSSRVNDFITANDALNAASAESEASDFLELRRQEVMISATAVWHLEDHV